jgi:hypothetical protein
MHTVPKPISELDEMERMSILYAFASRGVLEKELQLAEHRFYQQVVVMKIFELRFKRARHFGEIDELEKIALFTFVFQQEKVIWLNVAFISR